MIRSVMLMPSSRSCCIGCKFKEVDNNLFQLFIFISMFSLWCAAVDRKYMRNIPKTLIIATLDLVLGSASNLGYAATPLHCKKPKHYQTIQAVGAILVSLIHQPATRWSSQFSKCNFNYELNLTVFVLHIHAHLKYVFKYIIYPLDIELTYICVYAMFLSGFGWWALRSLRRRWDFAVRLPAISFSPPLSSVEWEYINWVCSHHTQCVERCWCCVSGFLQTALQFGGRRHSKTPTKSCLRCRFVINSTTTDQRE